MVSGVRFFAIVAAGLLAACSATSTMPRVPQRDTLRNVLIRQSTPQYEAVALPSGFVPNAIMQDGAIPGAIHGNAALYHDGELAVLGKYNGEPTQAMSANESGQVVGYASRRAVEYRNGVFSALPRVPNCQEKEEALSINDSGDVYGVCWKSGESDAPQIARFAPGSASLISGPLNGRGYSVDVNSSGEFAFTATIFAGYKSYAAFGTCLTSKALLPNYQYSGATSINDYGTIVGFLTNNSTFTQTNAFVHRFGEPVIVLPMVPTSTSMAASAINSYGTIVGTWSNASAANGIFLYKSGVVYDVTKSIKPADSYELLPGLADSGSFIVISTTNFRYALVRPEMANN